ncbi:MAG: DUF4397 domain-containing protein, partial [Anaerolineae bacterium]|nr:DUF4397 domain-containing protein [Anaerolineae bacterium]
MKTLVFILVALALAANVLGVGTAPMTVQAQQNAFVRFTHAAPDAPSVDIYLDRQEKPIIANVAFGKSSDIISVPQGTYTVRVQPAGQKDVVFRTVVGLRANQMVELVAQGILGGRGAQAFDIGAYRIDLSETGGRARVYVIHASPDAPAVDVRSGDTILLRRLAFGQANTRSPLVVPAGSVPIQVVATGTRNAVIDATLDLVGNRIYTVLAINRLANIAPLVLQALPRRSPPPAPEPKGFVRVTHASPDANNVDIYLNNNLAIANLEFGKSTDLIELAAGDYAVAIRPAGAPARSAPVFQTTLRVPANRTTEVVAMGLLNGSPNFMLGTYTIARSATNGKARIYLLHAAPKAPAVDVRANTELVLQKVAYGNFTSTPLEVAPGRVNLAATPNGRISPVVTRLIGNDAQFEGDTIYTLIALGNPIRNKLLVLKAASVSEAAEGKTADVRVLHVAKAPAVDVYLNDSPVAALTNVQAGRASNVVKLPTGEHKVQLRRAGQLALNLPFFEKTIKVGTNEWVEVVALGNFGGEPAFDINTYKMDNSFPYGKAKVHLLHAAPTAGAVDVLVNGQTTIQSVAFGDFAT